jgi:serine/threonine protein kinase
MHTMLGLRLEGRNGEYRLIEEMARGGMGALFKAQDLTHKRHVAVKTACLDEAACQGKRKEIRERLIYEMEVLASLDHPNIPAIYDRFSSQDNEFLVMEFIDGKTLMQIQQAAQREDRLLEESRVLGWSIQVLDTLHYLHNRPKPVIHRDVKPENLILAQDGRVVLVDFGLMKQVERQLESSGPLIRGIGTIEYAPPEQYGDSGGTTDARSDLYSLGATLYYLLASQLPPKAIDRMLPGSLKIATQAPSLQEINPTVSWRMDHVIRKALEIDPQARYQTAREMRTALAPRGRFIPLPF